MKSLLVLSILLTPLFSHAVKWVERGNGGFVLKCQGSERLQTLDMYEATQQFDGFDLSHLGSTDERMQHLLAKLEKINPSRAQLYRRWYATFMADSQFIANVDLSPVPDIGLGVKPKNCDFQLAVFQREPTVLNSKRYVVSLDIWNALDPINQAALIMHELIYRELIEFFPIHQTSESTRYFNGALNSAKFELLSQQDYLSLLQSLRFPRADYSGFTIRLFLGLDKTQWHPFEFKFHETGALKTALLEYEGEILPGNKNYLTCLTRDVSVAFHANGTLAEMDSYMHFHTRCSNFVYEKGSTRIQISDRNWKFDEKGHVISIEGSVAFEKNPSALKINGITIAPSVVRDYNDYTLVQLKFSNGELDEVTVDENTPSCIHKDQSKVELGTFSRETPLTFKIRTFAQEIAALPHCK